MVGIIPTKFHGHTFSGSKIIEGGVKHPPITFQSPKSYGINRVKSVLLSLKPSVETPLKSWLVYKIQCPRCNACYVGYTRRHLISRLKEHGQPKKPVAKHMNGCNHTLGIEDASILAQSTRSEYHLLILEALFIAQLKPTINTRDEYKSHKLFINLF